MVDTELLFLTDAYLQEFTATVVAVDDGRVALDRTAFYPTGGGQQHDTGTISAGGASAAASGVNVIGVNKEGPIVWHKLETEASDHIGEPGGTAPFAVGDTVSCALDWDRRHQLMRTHTALHILCGVIWNEWSVPVTGGNMEPLTARMDFEFDPLPDGFADRVTELVNAEITADRQVAVSFLPRDVAVTDEDLIRTKVNMIPEFVTEIRVIDIVGLDKQADGGTHVASTSEVGTFAITKTESKGKGNKRVRIQLS